MSMKLKKIWTTPKKYFLVHPCSKASYFQLYCIPKISNCFSFYLQPNTKLNNIDSYVEIFECVRKKERKSYKDEKKFMKSIPIKFNWFLCCFYDQYWNFFSTLLSLTFYDSILILSENKKKFFSKKTIAYLIQCFY